MPLKESRLQRVYELLDELSDAERMQVLGRIAVRVDNAGPRIKRKSGVCGGNACVAGTRIPVWLLVRARQLGGSEEEILADYPALDRDDLNSAWAYYALHREEIAQQIASNEN